MKHNRLPKRGGSMYSDRLRRLSSIISGLGIALVAIAVVYLLIGAGGSGLAGTATILMFIVIGVVTVIIGLVLRQFANEVMIEFGRLNLELVELRKSIQRT